MATPSPLNSPLMVSCAIELLRAGTRYMHSATSASVGVGGIALTVWFCAPCSADQLTSLDVGLIQQAAVQ